MSKFLPLLFLLISCASQIEVLTPASQFIYPESSGKLGKGKIFVNQMNGSMLGVNVNKTSAGPSLDTFKSQVALGVTGLLGLSEKIDFYAKSGTHAPNIVGAKIQLKGENFKETHSHNFSLAIQMGIGQNNYKGAGNQNFNLNLTGSDYTFNRTHTTTQLGILSGWRYEKYILLYGGLTQITENVHGTINYPGSTIDGKQIDLDGRHIQYSLGWLYQYNQYNLAIEYALQQMAWKGASRKSINSINLGFGIDY